MLQVTGYKLQDMIDRQMVFRKMKLMSNDLKEIRRISYLKEKEYFKNPIYEVQAERYLERIISRMIDINCHLIAESGSAPSSDYFGTFIELGKLKITPAEFAEKIAPYAGLRNRLVHEYNALNQKKIYSAIKRIIKDVSKYLGYIEKHIENPKSGKLLKK